MVALAPDRLETIVDGHHGHLVEGHRTALTLGM